MKIIVYDATDVIPNELELGDSWKLGSAFYLLRKKADLVIPATSWNQAIAKLNDIDKPITEIQFWGHGKPGTFFIAGKPLTQVLINQMNFKVDKLIWFRSCATFCGYIGRDFADRMAKKFNCTIAGHTHNIALFHSGLHTASPLRPASWPSDEGFTKEGKPKDSSFFAPNTITCLHSEVPKGW